MIYVLAKLLASASLALIPPGEIDQLGPEQPPAITTQQVNAPRATRPADLRAAQVSGAGPVASTDLEQLAPADQPTLSVQAGTPARPSAQAPAPLSTVAEGRSSQTERLNGRDRCDVAAARTTAQCAHILENRAAEFAPSDRPLLTPEQRLLVTEQLQGATNGADASARRLRRGDPMSFEDQSLAAAALARQNDPRHSPEPKGTPNDESAKALAIINALEMPKQ